MPAAIPLLRRFYADESQPGLVDQGRRLQRLPRFLLAQPDGRKFPQLVIHQRQQLLCRGRIALVDCGKDSRNVAHIRSKGAFDIVHLSIATRRLPNLPLAVAALFDERPVPPRLRRCASSAGIILERWQ
jgi:hypothetical protein